MLVSAAPISDGTALKAYEIFRDAMYQGCGQTGVLPIAMVSPPQWFAKGSPPLRTGGIYRCSSLSCRSGTRTTDPCEASAERIVASIPTATSARLTVPTTW